MDTLCCPNCSFFQLVEDNYCLRCGVNMFLFAAGHSVVMMCPECKEAGEGNYCKKCGNKLIGQAIHRRKKILLIVYLLTGVGFISAGGYWARNTWKNWKIRAPRIIVLRKSAQFTAIQTKVPPKPSPPQTIGKPKGLAREEVAHTTAKEKVSKQVTNTTAKNTKKEYAVSLSKRPAKKEKPAAAKRKVKEADPLEYEDLFKKGLLWFEKEIPKLRSQGLVDRVEESDPFVLYIYWAKWRYLSRTQQKDLLSQVKTARENMDFDEEVEFRDANSRELLASTAPNE